MVVDCGTLNAAGQAAANTIQILLDRSCVAGFIAWLVIVIGESIFSGDLGADFVFVGVADSSECERNALGFALGIGDEVENGRGGNRGVRFRALQRVKRDASSDQQTSGNGAA